MEQFVNGVREFAAEERGKMVTAKLQSHRECMLLSVLYFQVPTS